MSFCKSASGCHTAPGLLAHPLQVCFRTSHCPESRAKRGVRMAGDMDSSVVPAGTFVTPKGYDPLRHPVPSDLFWFHIEPSFRPFQSDDLNTLTQLSPTSHKEVDAPLAQRLVAALLDEGKGAASASRALRTTTTQESLWLPGTLPAMCTFNRIFENRVRVELEELGVLQPDDENEITERIRLDAWNLRNLGAASAESVRHVASNVADEVMAQSARRDLKRKHDQLEVGYIKKMMETGGKKARSRFSRLLRDMHPYHDLKVGAPFQPNGESGTGGGTASKKKKSSSKHRKSSSSKYDSSKY